MTVANAVTQWKTISQGFAGTGIKLVSPAVSDSGTARDWLDAFVAGVDADPELVVDEIAFHWDKRAFANANQFLAKLDEYLDAYNRPVLITEFALLDYANHETLQTQKCRPRTRHSLRSLSRDWKLGTT